MTAMALVAIAPPAFAEPPPDFMRGGPQPAKSVAAATLPAADAKIATVLEINGAIGPATSRYVTKATGDGSPQWKPNSRSANRHTRRTRHLNARHHPRDPGVAHPGRQLRLALGCPSGERRNLHSLRQSHCRDGAGNEPWRGYARVHRRRKSSDPDRRRSQPGKAPVAASQPKASDRHPEVQPTAQPPPTSAMERKVVNDAVAYIRGLAELRGRNAEWAEQAVRGAASLSATAALKENVIDVMARDISDLLNQIDGREVRVGNNDIKLATRDLAIDVKPDWRVELLSVITNPTIAYGLLLIGIYGLLFEGYNPGAVFPGVVGAISLLVALFAFQILSVNYAGLALVALGVGMIVAEFFFPTFGSLGLGGFIAFVVGSLILFDTDIPGMNIGLPVIAAIATVGGWRLSPWPGWPADRCAAPWSQVSRPWSAKMRRCSKRSAARDESAMAARCGTRGALQPFAPARECASHK